MGLLQHPMQKAALRADKRVDFFVIQSKHGRLYGSIYLGYSFDKAVVLTVGTRNLEAGQHVLGGMQRLPHIFF